MPENEIMITPPIHGGDIQGFARKAGVPMEAVKDFSSNINPLGVSARLRAVYQDSAADLSHYPDPAAGAFCRRAADEHGLTPENVIAGNGSIALIELAIRALRPKKALLVEPCFGEYRRLLALNGAAVDQIILTAADDFRVSLTPLLEKLSSVDLIVLGHPNNPTGTALVKEDLIVLMTEAQERGKHLLIDEAFVDWHPRDSVAGRVRDFSSTVVIRSLTKFYALAGIRAGYACAPMEIIGRMRACQETWSCNSVAQNLAAAALDDHEFQLKSRAWFNEESAFLFQALGDIPFLKVFHSRANFFLGRVSEPALVGSFWTAMRAAGIYLRDVREFVGLDESYFRVALKGREENAGLLKEMNKAISCQLSVISSCQLLKAES